MPERATVVVCDDEALLLSALVEHLQDEGYRTVPASDGEACLTAVREHAPALVLLDLRMPGMGGLEVLRKLREGGNDVPVVMITGHGDVDSAIEATRLGATAWLAKPFDLRELTITVAKALADDKLRQEVHYLRDRQRSGYGEFIGSSSALTEMFATLARLEKVDAPTVMISGESGTGKDLIARAIHARGPRRSQVFMEIDCASLPEPLIESELFGHERGAFTDAKTTKRGLLEVAAGGVVFLDEIGEMPIGTQARLLRTVESRKFKRVGGVASIDMDVAIIAATHRDLREEIRKGRFREDLFFRLDVIPVRLPALRDRKDDLPALISHFLDRFRRTFGREIHGVSGAAMQMLQAYDWPGNVRELRNVLERVVLLGPEGPIMPGDLPAEIRFWRGSPTGATAKCPFILPDEGVDLDGVEKGLLAQALDRTAGNQSAAARLLGITRYALRYRIEKHGLEPGGASAGREEGA